MSVFPRARASHTASTFVLKRSGSLPDDVTSVSDAMDSFASAATQNGGHPIIVMLREQGSINQYLVTHGGGDARNVAKILGDAVGAKPVALGEDEELVLDSSHVQRLEVPRFRQHVGRSTMAGRSPFTLLKTMASALGEDGQWVAVCFRKPTGREHKQWSRFVLSRGTETHHSLERDSVMASYFAGGGSADANKAALETLASSMPGFDENTKTRSLTVLDAIVRALTPLVLLSALFFLTYLGIEQLARALDLSTVAAPLFTGIIVSFIIIAALVVLFGFFVIVHRISFVRRPLPLHPPAHFFGYRRPVRTRRLDDGTIEKTEGERPFYRWVFKVAAPTFVGLAAPHIGGESGAAVTTARVAPSELNTRVGFCIGVDKRGSRVHLPVASAFEGTAIEGAAGKGKSQLQEAQFAFQLLERTHNTGLKDSPGAHNTLIFFDTKGDTHVRLQAWCRRFGVEPKVIHVADDPWFSVDSEGRRIPSPRRQNSDVIDVLALSGDVDMRARYVTDAMEQSMDEGDIRGQSRETLMKVFTAAFATTEEMVEAARIQAAKEMVPFIPVGNAVTPVSIAWAYLGDPDMRAGELLYAQLAAVAKAHLNDHLVTDQTMGFQALNSLYGPNISAAARRPLLQAPRNKVALLQAAQWLWDTSDHSHEVGSLRPGTPGYKASVTPVSQVAPRSVDTWDDLLRRHDVVIINSGLAPLSLTQMNEEATELITSMMFYTMRAAIGRVAHNWRAQGRKITIMADELSMIAPSNPETVEWLKEKGRAFGVELSLATQKHSQLPVSVKNSFLGFGTLVSFSQDDVQTAREIAENLAGDGEVWESKDVVNLPAFNVIVRTKTSQRLPAFTVQLENFEARASEFMELQLGNATLKDEQ